MTEQGRFAQTFTQRIDGVERTDRIALEHGLSRDDFLCDNPFVEISTLASLGGMRVDAHERASTSSGAMLEAVERGCGFRVQESGSL